MNDQGEYAVFTSIERQENVFSNNYLSQKKDLFDPYILNAKTISFVIYNHYIAQFPGNMIFDGQTV